MHTPHVLSGGRYPVLRSLAILYVIGAGLAAAATVIGIGYAILASRMAWTDRLIIAVGALAAGFFMVVSMLAIAEVLKLFIDIEHNTRVNAGGRIGMPASMTPEIANADGGGAHLNRLHALDEETAEAALLRGH
jgi:hypothetical protein